MKDSSISTDSEDDVALDTCDVELDFQPPLLHQCHSIMTLSSAARDDLISRGAVIRSGRWSKKENSVLLRNWYDFITKYPMKNPIRLIGLYEGQQRTLETFIKAKKFYAQLGKGLSDRTLSSIYARARKLLDIWNYKGKFTEEEELQLLQLHQKFGNKWTRIAVHLNRPAVTCRAAFECRKDFRRGPWSVMEDQLLFKAVKKRVPASLMNSFRGYPWYEISKSIPKRNDKQCRAHWLNNLCWKLREKERPSWNKKDTALLIQIMYSNMVEDECFIDWDFLFHHFKNVVPSYLTLQHKWSGLKSKVPVASRTDHESVVLYLYKNYLPGLLNGIHSSEKKS